MVNQPSDVILGAEKCKNEPLFGTKKALKYIGMLCISWDSNTYNHFTTLNINWGHPQSVHFKPCLTCQ